MAYDAEKDATLEVLGSKMMEGDKTKGVKLIIEVKSYDGGEPKLSIIKRFYPSKRVSPVSRMTMADAVVIRDILKDADLSKYTKPKGKTAAKPTKGADSEAPAEKPTKRKTKKLPTSSENLKGRLRDAAGDDESDD